MGVKSMNLGDSSAPKVMEKWFVSASAHVISFNDITGSVILDMPEGYSPREDNIEWANPFPLMRQAFADAYHNMNLKDGHKELENPRQIRIIGFTKL